jgi:hypothetical protein
LFSFDATTAPVPAAPAKSSADAEFDAFAAKSAGTVGPSAEFDAFGSFKAAEKPAAPTAVDPFAAPAPVAAANGQSNMAQMGNMFGQMNVGNAGVYVMNGGTQQQSTAPVDPFAPAPVGGDDDFGDFEGASSTTAQKAVIASKPQDPMSRLIHLDSLEKNKKKVDTLNQPVYSTPAAAQYAQQYFGTQSGPSNSFQGIDGLGGGSAMVHGITMGSASAGGANAIAMMDPSAMMPKKPQPQSMQQGLQQRGMQQQGMHQGMQQQGMHQGMPQQGMHQGMQQNTGGMMNPQMMQQQHGMHGTTMMQGGMGGMQMGVMHGGMQQGSMGMMNPQMMNQQGNMMGGMQQGMGNMQGNTMGGMGGGQMGGQPMQGWR